MEEIENNIGYTFKNKELLERALTHTSYANEKKLQSNEKLEFMGDSILEFISSKYLYTQEIVKKYVMEMKSQQYLQIVLKQL